jgi:hypothetical protein
MDKYLLELLKKKKMRIVETFNNMQSGIGYELLNKDDKVVLDFPTSTKEETESFVLKHFFKRKK